MFRFVVIAAVDSAPLWWDININKHILCIRSNTTLSQFCIPAIKYTTSEENHVPVMMLVLSLCILFFVLKLKGDHTGSFNIGVKKIKHGEGRFKVSLSWQRNQCHVK